MKKIFVLLLISALAIFVFTGCDGFVPGEGEGEGEGEPESVSVEIEDYYKAPDGKIYVAGGMNKITVTFPAPVSGIVTAEISDCSGDYSKAKDVILLPNEDKTIWTGSAKFDCTVTNGGPCDTVECLPQDCCASIVTIKAGECEADTCIQVPVILDCEDPYAALEVSTESCNDPCDPGKCAITLKSTEDSDPCGPDDQCCGDDCSGLTGWSVAIYNEDPFDDCCATPCYEPIFTDSGTGCPIEVTTDCLGDDEKYYVVVNMVDNVGNETNYYATIEMESTCLPEKVDFELARQGNSYFQVTVTDFMSEGEEDYPGWCTDAFTFISLGDQDYNANIYPSIFLPENFCAANVGDSASWNSETWSRINWILNNQDGYIWQEVQSAIWDLIHRDVCVEDPDEVVGWVCVCDGSETPLAGADPDNVKALLKDACSNTGYVPGPDDLVAVVLLEGDNCPNYSTPNRGCPDDCSPAWDANAFQMIIIEVKRSEVDCPCEIVEVLEYQQNDLGCTDWENPIDKPDHVIGNCGNIRFR